MSGRRRAGLTGRLIIGAKIVATARARSASKARVIRVVSVLSGAVIKLTIIAKD